MRSSARAITGCVASTPRHPLMVWGGPDSRSDASGDTGHLAETQRNAAGDRWVDPPVNEETGLSDLPREPTIAQWAVQCFPALQETENECLNIDLIIVLFCSQISKHYKSNNIFDIKQGTSTPHTPKHDTFWRGWNLGAWSWSGLHNAESYKLQTSLAIR